MPLERVNLTAPETQYSIVIHGDTGCGKTSLAATFPRPLFLSPADEAGWETLKHTNPDTYFERDRLPIVWKLTKALDIVEGLKDVQPLIKSGDVKTVVIDSLTFWTEMYYDHLLSSSASKDPRQVFGLLGDHLRNVRSKFQLLPVNIVWLCLTKYPDENTKLALPEIKGRQAGMFAAGCKYLWYMRVGGNDGKTRELKTRKFGNILARGRDGGRLPDTIPNPTYRKIHELLTSIPIGEFVDRSEEDLIAEAEGSVPQAAEPETVMTALQETPPKTSTPVPTPKVTPRPSQPVPARKP
jgi:hypothetical protein